MEEYELPILTEEYHVIAEEHEVFLKFINDEDRTIFEQWWEKKGLDDYIEYRVEYLKSKEVPF